MHISLPPEQEQQLVEDARHSADAFRELYRHYFPRVYAYVAYRVEPVWETEDLVSDIFVKVVESISNFEYRGIGSFAAWIFRIAHNHLSYSYRQRADHLSLDDVSDISNEDFTPDQAFIRQEQFEHLQGLLQTLSPRRQEIITLKFFGGLRNQDIATILGLDERTVASHLCRGIEDLGRMYKQQVRRDATHEPE